MKKKGTTEEGFKESLVDGGKRERKGMDLRCPGVGSISFHMTCARASTSIMSTKGLFLPNVVRSSRRCP